MPAYWISELQTLDDSKSLAWDDAMAVNASGEAAGFVVDASNPDYPMEAATWNDGGSPNVLEAPPPDSLAYGINDNGDVVGLLHFAYPRRAFYYKQATGDLHDLGPLLGDESIAVDVNNEGVAVGGVDDIATSRPFVFDSNNDSVDLLDPLPGHTFAYATGINELGHVVGASSPTNSGGDSHVFVYRDGNMEDLGGAGTVVFVTRMNDSDVVTGTMVVPGSAPIWPWQAFRLDTTAATPTFQPIGHSQALGYLSSHGYAINNDGVVVGHSFNKDEKFRPFVDIPDGPDAGFYDLQDVLLDGAGWELETAEDISDTGYIVGRGTYQGQYRAYLLTPKTTQAPWNKYVFEALEAILLFGGAPEGGPGIAILPGGIPIPIDPHSPARPRLTWERMSPAERDAQVGLAIRNLANALANSNLEEVARRAGTEIAQAAMEEVNREPR